jgi:riboflavin synthase
VFTGIVEEVGKVASIRPGNLVVNTSQDFQGLELGGSIAINGACLTITGLNSNSFSVDIMSETLKRTNIGLLSAGDRINLERPLTLNKPLGGHLVQGHIDATGRVAVIRQDGDARMVRIEATPEVMRYVVEKGFIAIDGISLTVVDKDASSFQVSIVDYTFQHTNLGDKKVGDLVNLEVDIIAKYVEQFNQNPGTGITVNFLQEHGFMEG